MQTCSALPLPPALLIHKVVDYGGMVNGNGDDDSEGHFVLKKRKSIRTSYTVVGMSVPSTFHR